MRWKNLPNWLRKGLIGGFLSLGLYLLYIGCVFSLRDSEGWTGFVCYVVGTPLVGTLRSLLVLVRPSLALNMEWEKNVAFSYLAILGFEVVIFWFILVALLVWIYDKFKGSRTWTARGRK